MSDVSHHMTDQNSMQRSLMWCRRDLAMFVKIHVQPSHHDRMIEQLERQDERYTLIKKIQ
jgi:hypothetical protein